MKIRLFLLLVTIFGSYLALSAENKGLWVTAWDFNTPEKIEQVVEFALSNNISQLMVQARYRGDALYQPNRIYRTYSNPEPKSYLLKNNDFDPLAYILEQVENTGIDIHAWVTVFVVASANVDTLPAANVSLRCPEWVTADIFEERMTADGYEGIYLDPGIPDVHDYLINVFKDIAVNYDISGLHLDYVRYPDVQFGYAEKAKQEYFGSSEAIGINLWKEKQVTAFVRKCYAEIKHIDRNLLLTTAVISNLDRAVNKYSQNWLAWLEEGIVDYVFPMSYSLSDEDVQNELFSFQRWKERIVVGLRAWNESQRVYSAADIISKIELIREANFNGYALFSYGGLQEIMEESLHDILTYDLSSGNTLRKKNSLNPLANNILFGYVTDSQGNALNNVHLSLSNGGTQTTDSGGFFMFSSVKPDVYELRAEKGIAVFFSDYLSISQNNTVSSCRYDIEFWKRE